MGKCWECVGVTTLVSLVLIQGVCLIQYPAQYEDETGWHLFAIPFALVALFVIGLQCLGKRPELIFVAWIFYVVFLSVVVGYIFGTLTDKLNPDSFFGPHVLEFLVALSAGIFLLMDSNEFIPEPEDIDWLRVLDLIDTAEFLGVLIGDEGALRLDSSIKVAIIVLACLSFLLPAVSLYRLREETECNDRILQVILCNIPFFVVRSILYFHYKLSASRFMVKNILVIVVHLVLAVN